MGRSGIGGQVLVRLGDGVPERIDAVAGKGGRSEFVRQAVLAALDGAKDIAPVEAELERAVPAKPVVKPSSDRWAADGAEVLRVLRGRRMTARDLSRELVWAELRVERALRSLGDRVVFSGGGVVEVASDD